MRTSSSARSTALLTDPAAYAAMANAVNPYGDGHAARRSVQAIESYFGLGEMPDDFDPEDPQSRAEAFPGRW